MARNLEIKARDPDPLRSAAACRRLGADDHGLLRQRDTYFAVPHGRLKVREQSTEAELIFYERADVAHPRESRYVRVPIVDATALKNELGAELGVTVVVEKQRQVFVWEGIRIHLDEVEGLGSFVELEAVMAEGETPASAARRLGRLREALGIEDDRLVGPGYADQ